MKNIFLLLLLALTHSCAQKQGNYDSFDTATHNPEIKVLQGNWRISELVSDAGTKKYSLTPQSKNTYENYGNNIVFNADQTFISGYSAECGNDCFTTTKGKYKIVDENYICFYLTEISRSGDCTGNSLPNKDLGLYYYYKDAVGFKLLRSSGSLEQDQKNTEYLKMIATKRSEIEGFDYRGGQNQLIYNWKHTNLTDEKEMVAFCMAENQIGNYEILASDNGGIYSRLNIILVKADNELRYVLYDNWGTPMVSLYNDFEIRRINKSVSEIDSDTSLRKMVRETKNTISSLLEKRTITLYKRNNVVSKAIYTHHIKYGEKVSVAATTIYFQESTPIYVDYQTSPDQNREISETGLYVLDWQNNKGASKIIKSYFGKIHKVVSVEKPFLNKIMDEIKTLN